MRFRVFKNVYGTFYAKRQVWGIFWVSVKGGYGGDLVIVKNTHDEMMRYLYDTYLPLKKIHSKETLVEDFRI